MKSGYKPPMIGSFEDIGRDVAREVANVPTDIGGKILESLTGAPSVKGQQQRGNTQQEGGDVLAKKSDGALGAMDETRDLQVKRAIARAALEQLAGKSEQPVSSVWEEKQKDEQEKKEFMKKEDKKAAFAAVPHVSSKKRRGDMYGIQGKSSTEMSKNVRQD